MIVLEIRSSFKNHGAFKLKVKSVEMHVNRVGKVTQHFEGDLLVASHFSIFGLWCNWKVLDFNWVWVTAVHIRSPDQAAVERLLLKTIPAAICSLPYTGYFWAIYFDV